MDHEPLPVRPQAIAAAYVLAVLCLAIPLSVVGSTFAGAVLWRRGLGDHGAAVIAFGVACTATGLILLR